MNELNNNENNNQVVTTPVAPVTSAPAPVESVQEPVSSPQPVTQPTPVEATPAPAVVETVAAPSTPTEPEKAPSTDTPADEGGTTSTEPVKDETDGKLRFPLVVVLLLVVVIVFLFVYYFVLITPKNLFSKALKAQMDALTTGLFAKDTEHKTATYLIDSKFEASPDGVVNFLSGLEYKFSLSHDIEKGNFGVNVVSNIDTLDGGDRIEHNQNINSSFYYYDRALMYKFTDNILKTDTHGDSLDNTSEFMALLNEVSYEAIDLIDISKVTRTIESKKIKDQSLLAIRFSTSFDNAEINRIWQTTIDNMLDSAKHPDFVKKFAENLDITEEQAIDTIKNFKNINVNSKEIKLDYYLNLACNNLVAFELTIDNVKILMSYLSGYYFLEVDTDGVDIDFNYNYKNSDFDGEIILDNENTYSLVEFASVTKLNDNHEKIGNTVSVKFFNEKTKGSSEKAEAPYLAVNSDISFEYDKELTFFDSSKVVPIENASVEDLEKLAYMTNKIKYELFYLVGLNTVNRTEMTPRMFAENMLTSMGETIIVPEVPVDTPVVEESLNSEVVETPAVQENVNNQEEVNTNNNVVEQNIATKSE